MNKVLISLIAVFGFMMQSSVYAEEVPPTSEAVTVSTDGTTPSSTDGTTPSSTDGTTPSSTDTTSTDEKN